MDPLKLCPLLVVLVATIIASFTDVRRFRIYNTLTMPLLVGGIVYHATVAHTSGLLMSIAGVVCGGGVLLVMYLLGGMGAGDVKLISGIGAWLGPSATLSVLIASSLATVVYGLIVLARHGGMARTLKNFQVMCYQIRAIGAHLVPEERVDSMPQDIAGQRRIPYGPMLVVGIVTWLLCKGISS
jgi:prepilin peptidase CpaA